MRVTSLTIHPVKACAGVPVQRATLDDTGLLLDRRWMIVDAAGRFVTQRTHPALALVAVAVHDDHVSMEAPGHAPLALPLAAADDAPRRVVTVWDDTVSARDASSDASAWVRSALGFDGAVVWVPTEDSRQVDRRFARPGDRVGFADGFPLLLATDASLADLNARLSEPVTMARFRPNVTVDGDVAFDEDLWSVLRIGAALARAAKPCARCSVVNVDPATGATGLEPLRTLATYRTFASKVFFAQNVVHFGESVGLDIAVGDEVTVQCRRVDPGYGR